MKRSELKRKTPLRSTTPLKPGNARMPRRSRPRRPEGYRDTRMLEACRGEPCFLAVPGVCGGEGARETVVPAHSNSAEHGKGGALKAMDRYSVPACFYCHAYLDQGPADREVKRAIFDDALRRWAPVRARKLNIKDDE